jgi:hypothetical protein
MSLIEILEQSSPTCLAVRFSGKVTGEEYQQFLDALGYRLGNKDKVSLVCELVEFEFYGDFDSAKKDFQFGFGDYKRICRAAFVGDQKWLEWFTRLIGPFTRVEEKFYTQSQYDEAIEWACSNVPDSNS